MINLEVWTPYEFVLLASDGAKANQLLSPTVGSRQRFVVADLAVVPSNATTVNVAFRVGFGVATVPAAGALVSVAGVLASSQGASPGIPIYGRPGMGQPDEELRFTCDAPTLGAVSISFLGRMIQA